MKLVLRAMPVIALLLFGLFATGCGSTASSLVGTWSSENGEILVFEDDSTCSIPFTYSNAWWESCDRYTIKDDDTLVLSSSQGNISSRKYSKTDNKAEAEENSSCYYLSSSELVINETVYTR